MYRILLTGVLILSFSMAATAQTARKELRGFENLRFGMSEQEARNVRRFVKAENEKAGVRLTAGDPVELDGLRYELSIRLQGGRIEQIELASTEDTNKAACAARWRRALASIQKRHGPPDKRASETKFESVAFLTSDFTFKDGNQIGVTSLVIGTFCVVNISFFQKGALQPAGPDPSGPGKGAPGPGAPGPGPGPGTGPATPSPTVSLRICNKTSVAEVIYVATVAIVGQQFRAQGWTQVRRGDCAVIGSFERPRVLWHARTPQGQTWGQTTVPICVNLNDRFEYTWSGSPRTCLQNEALVAFKEETFAADQRENTQNLVD